MAYARPQYTREEVNAAGRVVRDMFLGDGAGDFAGAIAVVDNWRASHAYPLNSFAMTLRNRSSRISASAVVSQRVKRLHSIAHKLITRRDMKLTQMQDIGGCRAVLPSLADVERLRGLYEDDARIIHLLSGAGSKDYIDSPKASGYRSLHLKYRFTGRERTRDFNQLKIEIQVRTALQHQWATAVESAGTLTRAALKSSVGAPHWLRFFALMSSIFALREGAALVPDTPHDFEQLRAEVIALDREHRIAATFAQYNALVAEIEGDYFYYLVRLDPDEGTVDVRGFAKSESKEANHAYTHLEQQIPSGSPTQVVLVSVASLIELRRAYPNYFMDTAGFLGEVRSLTRG